MKKLARNDGQCTLWQDEMLPIAVCEKKKTTRARKSLPVIRLSSEVGKIARGCHSSTSMKYFIENCPQALAFYKQGKPQSTEHFQVGIAAHSVLQMIGEKKATEQKAQERIANAVVRELITVGRKYYDEKKPPMSPEHAYAGRDLALQYLAQNKLPEDAKYEIVLAMDKHGKPCDLENARYRAIIDCIYETVEGDDDFLHTVIVVRDYKSAWNADENELETLQRKSQAVLAALHFPKVQGVRMEVVNIRTGKVYSKVIYLDDCGREQIASWRRDILMLCDAADKTSAARPGVGCQKCPFLNSCPDAEKLAASAKNAEALAVINAKREQLIAHLKSQLDGVDGIRIPDGYIGYKNLPKNEVAEEAPYQILSMWFDRPLEEVPHVMPKEVGLLRAMKLGVTQIENVARQLFNGDGEIAREDFINLCLKKTTRREFNVWQASEEELDQMFLIPSNASRKAANRKAPKPKKSKTKRAA